MYRAVGGLSRPWVPYSRLGEVITAMGRHRSAITGRFISRAAGARHPRTSIFDNMGGSGRPVQVNRSAISGRFISNAAAARHPRTSLRETIKR